MLLEFIRFILCVLFVGVSGQLDEDDLKRLDVVETQSPLPFPACKAYDIECQKRSIRTFFFYMDTGYFGMKPVDPLKLNSIGILLPDQQMSLTLRKINVTGARWTKLFDRKFIPYKQDSTKIYHNSVVFKNDLHVTGEIVLTTNTHPEPLVSYLTMDIGDVESNITYRWKTFRDNDRENYLQLSNEKIAVRNTRLPTFFLYPDNNDAHIIIDVLETRLSTIDHLSNEIVTAVMQEIIDNCKIIASKVPIKYYYKTQ